MVFASSDLDGALPGDDGRKRVLTCAGSPWVCAVPSPQAPTAAPSPAAACPPRRWAWLLSDRHRLDRSPTGSLLELLAICASMLECRPSAGWGCASARSTAGSNSSSMAGANACHGAILQRYVGKRNGPQSSCIAQQRAHTAAYAARGGIE